MRFDEWYLYVQAADKCLATPGQIATAVLYHGLTIEEAVARANTGTLFDRAG